jgi:hypothetical protein
MQIPMQTRDVQDEIIPHILHQIKATQCVDEVWDAWYQALLEAAPLLHRPTADRSVLMYAITTSTSSAENSMGARVRACKLLAVAAKALVGSTEVRAGTQLNAGMLVGRKHSALCWLQPHHVETHAPKQGRWPVKLRLELINRPNCWHQQHYT